MNEAINITGALQLDNVDLLIASLLVLMTGTVSLLMKLKLEKQLFVAALRAVVQLLLIGYILKWIFSIENIYAIALLGILMVLAAGRASVSRSRHQFKGITWRSQLTLVVVSFTTTVIVTAIIIRVDPWYKAQYVIPLLGMILGNSLTGLSLCIDSILETLSEKSAEVEMELSLGASKWEAARTPVTSAVRRGIIPMINSMMVVGIVSLPGMMTGQILQGADPLNAVKYQIVVMFMISASTALSSMIIAYLIYRRLFSAKHQLLSHLISEK